MTRLRAAPHPGPLCRERFRRKILRIEPLHRSSRREEALAISDFRFRISDFRLSLLTSAATRFMGSLFLVAAYQMVAASPSGGVEFFEKKIRPVLVERCYKCHSARSDKV